MDYIRREGMEAGEFYILVLLAAVGMMLMASAGDALVTFHGKGGHGSSPWLSKDPISVMVEAIAAIPTMITKRFDAWLNPFDSAHYDAIGGSYQLVQGIFGMAHGSVLGTGLGGGVPQLVPLAESDFIISSLGEELGLAGIFAILAVYLLIVSRGVRIAFNHSDDFSKLLAVGLSFVIALQTFIVIGGVTRVVPLTGLTTPLLAAGGSSLLANWIIVGLLLRISDTADRGEKQVAA